MANRQKGKGIVVAVDFGTTFSGVAWAQTANITSFSSPNFGTCLKYPQPDTHYIINQWPQNSSCSLDGMTCEKVPTEVAYKY